MTSTQPVIGYAKPVAHRVVMLTCYSVVIRDPMDKNFDLEAYLNVVSAEST